MSQSLLASVVTVLMGIIGVAILAVLVSRNAQTPQVVQASGAAFSQSLATALSPITGGSFSGGAGYSLGGL